VVWKTDAPVRFFNVVAGPWTETRGEHGTAIYHHPGHTYNIEVMVEVLDAARVYYSEWFAPYPWKELKLSEFPGLAGYAQGFPTNITFSESIGFLTKDEQEAADAPFFVTAHETAHQWWGNLLCPGLGPGGNLLSEGTAHFSTLLLFEQVRGLEARIAFSERIEDQYGEGRVADSERPLVETDGERPGDTTVTYDKAGWVFWMLLNHMGRERCLEGMRAFIAYYVADRDHPVLQDFLRHMRPFAQDPEAFDAFTQQWFFEVVLPEYELSEVEVKGNAEAGWKVDLTLTNVGSGRLPVEVCASRGTRFGDEDGGDPYGEKRATVTLGAGESAQVSLECVFEPERVVVDPDALVLQLRRTYAREDLGQGTGE
jgi:ABC-2 type transport system permease protein